MSLGRLWLLALVGLSAPTRVRAEGPCVPALNALAGVPDEHSPKQVLTALQRKQLAGQDVLADQNDFECVIREGGGGACATATAFNFLQALRAMAGAGPDLSPHKTILQNFRDNPELRDGRVTNEQMAKLRRSYERHLGGARIRVGVESAAQWGPTGPDLSVKSGELKMLIYEVSERGSSEPIGRHFVILKESVDGKVTVLDPNAPKKDYGYTVRKVPQEDGSTAYELKRSSGPPSDYKFRVHTVFAAQLDRVAKGTTPTLSLDGIRQQIDRLAAELKGSADFLSPRVWREKAAAFGLTGLDLPTELGGANWKPSQMAEVFEHLGEHNLNLRDVVGGAHSRALLKSPESEMREVVRQVGEGKAYVAIAITEPEAGANMRAMKSAAKRVDGGYHLTGAKRYNARFRQGTHVVVFTQAPDQAAGKLNAFLLPMDYPGLKFEQLDAHGLDGNSFGGVSFEDLYVPEKFRIGADGEGGRVFRDHFLYWRLMQAAAAIGTGKGALKQMAERMRNRQAFGAAIGRFTHLQQQLAEHTAKLEMASTLVQRAAKLLDEGRYAEAEGLVAMAKAEGVEFALAAADDAMRAFGAEGYTTNVDIGQRVIDLMGLRIADGPTDLMRQQVVRRIYGDDLWQMAIGTESP